MKRAKRSGSRALALLMIAAAAAGALLAGIFWLRPLRPVLELPPQLLDRPFSVLIVSFDALRADALGSYGYDRPTSPNMDAFAQEALMFERATTVAPVTPTSFAGALTGMYPYRVFRGWQLDGKDTIGARFAAGGYITAMLTNNIQLTPERNFGAGFHEYVLVDPINDEHLIQHTARWLAGHRTERFLLWVHFLAPHVPYPVRKLAGHLYDSSYTGRFEDKVAVAFDTRTPEELRRVRDLYDGNVLYADDLFRRMLMHIQNFQLENDTIVVLTADHGEEFKEHGHLQHGWLTQEHVRIPLMIRIPSRNRPPTGRIPERVSNLDLYPTLAALVGLEAPPDVDGRNLLRASGDAEGLLGLAYTREDLRLASIRRGDEKLIVDCMPAPRVSLFDLADDPGELQDLASSRADRVEQLERELWDRFALSGCAQYVMHRPNTRPTGPTEGLSRESVEGLKALGYLEK